MNSEENLRRIQELAMYFTKFEDMSEVLGNMVKYETITGECIGYGLKKLDTVAVQRCLMSPGCVLLPHNHKEIETLVIYEGDLTVESEKGELHFKTGDTIKFNIDETHLVRTTNGCKMIAITIPSSEGYPNAYT